MDRQDIDTLVNLILKENSNYRTSSTLLLKSLMTSILEILLRNIKQSAFSEINEAATQDNRITNLCGQKGRSISDRGIDKYDKPPSLNFRLTNKKKFQVCP